MKKYQKIFFPAIILFSFILLFNANTAKASILDDIGTQISIIMQKILLIQEQIKNLFAASPSPSAAPNASASHAPKSVALLSPNGKEILEVGKSYDIKWNSAIYPDNAKIQINLINERDLNPVELKIANTTNNGIYNWKINDLLNGFELYGSLNKIIVYMGEGVDRKSDTSDNYFSITKPMTPYLNIISPNGGETFANGNVLRIKWDYLGLENDKITINLKRNNIVYLKLADRVANNSYYDWEIPTNLYGSAFKIQINAYDGNENLTAQKTSNTNFIIIQNPLSKNISYFLANILEKIKNMISW